MKAVLQVVKGAKLTVAGQAVSEIGKGMVVFFCAEKGDNDEKLAYIVKKIAGLRIFADENGKTNLSVKDVEGEILFVSQFTLAGDCERGFRPSFFGAEEPERAKKMYVAAGKMLESFAGVPVKYGVFGADMQIEQINDGPFTILLEK